MKYRNTVAPEYIYDDDGEVIGIRGEARYHRLYQRAGGRLAATQWVTDLSMDADRAFQATIVRTQRTQLRAFIAAEAGAGSR